MPPFGDITVNGKTYNPVTPGVYQENSVDYNSPADEIRISGARTKSSSSGITCSASRFLGKVDPETEKQYIAAVQVEMRVPKDGDFTTTEIDTLVSEVSEFLTPVTISRMLRGES